MGRVRTKTVKKASKVIIEKYYTRLTLDFHTNKRICEEIAIIPTKPLRNKIAGFVTHLMKRLRHSQVRGISIKLQEEERERRDNYVPEVSALEHDIIEVDSETKEMLKMLEFNNISEITTISIKLQYLKICYSIKNWKKKKLTMGRVRTKTVKKASKVIIEKYYTRLTLDFHTNKRICEEIAIIPTKPLRNKIAGFVTHLMKRLRHSQFIDKFNEVKEATRSAISKVTANGAVTPVTSANASPITARAAAIIPDSTTENLLEPPGMLNTAKSEEDNMPHLRSHSLSGIPSNESPSHQGKGDKITYGQPGGATPGASTQSDAAQLKYENDRLKLALAQSSANAKKWEVELATLKSNNARLTSALQESTANVDEWKRQLHSYKEENMRMKAKYQSDLENSKGGGEIADELRKEIQNLRHRVEMLETEIETKNKEIQQFSSHKLSELTQNLQRENQELQTTVKLAQSELDVALGAHESQRQVLLTLNQQFASRVQELATIHDEITTALQT
ncbi:hypothetical protein FQA39_LY07878 [Lamprigera yunnana]|nr:hypothetical protein FQA39_LY07878 [Lamprigera yunnana]